MLQRKKDEKRAKEEAYNAKRKRFYEEIEQLTGMTCFLLGDVSHIDSIDESLSEK